jgi:hypothetical protein
VISLASTMRRPALLFDGERAFPFEPSWQDAIRWYAMAERVMGAPVPDVVPWSL